MWILALIIYKFGSDWIDVGPPPAAMEPVVALIGLELSSTVASNAGMLDEKLKSGNVIVFLVTLGVAVFGSVVFRNSFPLSLFSLPLLRVILQSLPAKSVDFQAVAEAPLFALPNFGTPKFNAEAIMIILPVILVITSQHIGHQIVTGKVVGRNLI